MTAGEISVRTEETKRSMYTQPRQAIRTQPGRNRGRDQSEDTREVRSES